jgi:hypothetical protein
MTQTFAALLFAHVLADFVLQPTAMVRGKGRPGWLALHGLVVLATAWAATGATVASVVPLVALALAHVGIDLVKASLPDGAAGATEEDTPDPARSAPAGAFLADQAAHLATLFAAAALAPGLWAGGLWQGIDWLAPVMALAAGAIAATRAGGFAVGLLMRRYDGTKLPRGLPDGGRLIGVLERGMIFLLVLAGQPAGIGFLIAAKSILRFDTTSRNQRAGEYVIIGTLASFGWAMAVAYGTLALLARLPDIGFGVGIAP